MHSEFCKVFKDDEVGQILVIQDTNEDDKPSVIFKFIPEGLGVCESVNSFSDTEKGWSQCDTLFDSIDHEKAVGYVKLITETIG